MKKSQKNRKMILVAFTIVIEIMLNACGKENEQVVNNQGKHAEYEKKLEDKREIDLDFKQEIFADEQPLNMINSYEDLNVATYITKLDDTPMYFISDCYHDQILYNDNIDDENSVIIAGQEIIISVPEPELSVVTMAQEAYNEDYKADTIYIENDSWFTNQTEVRQEATTGNRDVVAQITYRNGKEVSRNIIQETVNKESQPAIVERGTIVPPTYIKPLYGGIFTSGFKYRWGRWHKGLDYACPVGTSIMASSGGVVSAAGWASG